MEDLFPGLTSDLEAQGAPLTDPRVHGRWFLNGGYYDTRQVGGGQSTLLVSRPLLEGTIRARVLGLPNVRAIECCDARPGRRPRSSACHRRAGCCAGRQAAGRGDDGGGGGGRQRTRVPRPSWLEALGYQSPVEEQVRVGLAYTSRFHARRPDDLGGDHFAMVFPTRHASRRVAAAQDGNRWLVTLVGYLGEHAPTDEAGYRDYASALPAPDIYNLVTTAEPLSDPVTMRFPANQRRLYERLADFPRGFVVVGDALCSFNPVYAQGMTVAGLEAMSLGQCPRAGSDHLSETFFRHARKGRRCGLERLGGRRPALRRGGRQVHAEGAVRQLVPRPAAYRRPPRRSRGQGWLTADDQHAPPLRRRACRSSANAGDLKTSACGTWGGGRSWMEHLAAGRLAGENALGLLPLVARESRDVRTRHASSRRHDVR